MIAEYEIPKGSKLYFGEMAKKKREIENICVDFFNKEHYEEIVTPYFSYHQSLSDPREIIRFSDESNNSIALRADSTLEVVRIIQKRLGRTTDHQKWFYVQPVFSYPTTESHQIGCEWIGCDNILSMIDLSAKILNRLGKNPTLQFGNINIPKKVAQILNIDIELLSSHEMEKLLEMNIDWLNKLIYSNSVEDLISLQNLVPKELKPELEKVIKYASKIDVKKLTISPLYYTKMEYYDDIYFRFIENKKALATGGSYVFESVHSCGFSIYTDLLIQSR